MSPARPEPGCESPSHRWRYESLEDKKNESCPPGHVEDHPRQPGIERERAVGVDALHGMNVSQRSKVSFLEYERPELIALPFRIGLRFEFAAIAHTYATGGDSVEL